MAILRSTVALWFAIMTIWGSNISNNKQLVHAVEERLSFLELLELSGDLSIFWNLVQRTSPMEEDDNSDIKKILECRRFCEQHTFFVPTNDAFAAYSEEQQQYLINQESQRTLDRILRYHMVDDVIRFSTTSTEVEEGLWTSLEDDEALVTTQQDGIWYVNGARVQQLDEPTLVQGGVVHRVDRLLIPPSMTTLTEMLAETDELSYFHQLVVAAGQEDSLDFGYTILAPTNDAFHPVVLESLLATPTDVLSNLVRYHMLPTVMHRDEIQTGIQATAASEDRPILVQSTNDGQDESSFLWNGKVGTVATDLEVFGGVIHVIDSILLPPSSWLVVAAANGFSLFRRAVENSGIAVTEATTTTVFAPNNEAMFQLPESVWSDTSLLSQILSFHMVDGTLILEDIMGSVLTSRDGNTLNISNTDESDGGRISINDSAIVLLEKHNLVAWNGMVHGISSVLIPPGITIT